MTPRHDYTEDYYAVLGVARGASDDEIRRAGRAKQRAAHPDLGGSTEAFMRVRVAVEVLSDPELRADHDAWLDGRSRGRRGRLRTQRRSGDTTGTATAGRADAAHPGGASGARRPPGTFVPRAETPPPARIPRPDTDVRRTAWYRTAWPATPGFWPPERAGVPGLRAGELAWVLLHALVLVAATVLLVLPGSVAELRFPSLVEGAPGPSLWALVAVFAAVGAAWFACRVAVRGRLLARLAHLATTGIAAVSAVLAGALSLLALVTSPEFLAGAAFQRLLVQSALFAAYAVTAFVTWRVLGPRARTALRDRLLVDLATASAPPASDPTRVWGKPGQTAMAADEMPPGVNPMRAMLAQQVVGEALEQLQRIPGVRIVHGLRAPGVGTVAHALIAGRRIALVDAELWAPGDYGVGGSGMITRDGDDVPTAAVEFPHVVERYHRLFGETAQVRGWISIVADQEGDLTVDTRRTWQRVRLASVPTTLREVGDWLAEEGAQVDRLLVRDLLRHRA